MKRVFSCLCLAVALTGCTLSRSDLDNQPVTSTLKVPGSFDQVYSKLLTEAPAGSVCRNVVDNSILRERSEFRIYYGVNSPSGPSYFDSVYGRQTGDQVLIQFRNQSINGRSGYRDPVTHFLTSGYCN